MLSLNVLLSTLMTMTAQMTLNDTPVSVVSIVRASAWVPAHPNHPRFRARDAMGYAHCVQGKCELCARERLLKAYLNTEGSRDGRIRPLGPPVVLYNDNLNDHLIDMSRP